MPERRSHAATLVRTLGLAAVLLVPAATARAEDPGRLEYMYNCSSCHGDSARGDGPIARFINVETPSLVTLAQRNGGAFPLQQVIEVIDGRSTVGLHGTEMPVWGARFMASAMHDTDPYPAAIIARGRILALAQYLESIQE